MPLVLTARMAQWERLFTRLWIRGILYAFNCGFDDKGITQLLDWMIPNAAQTLLHFYTSNTRIGSILRQLRGLLKVFMISTYLTTGWI